MSPSTGPTLQALGVSEQGDLRCLPFESAGFRWIHEETPKASLQQAWRDPVQSELAEYLHFSR